MASALNSRDGLLNERLDPSACALGRTGHLSFVLMPEDPSVKVLNDSGYPLQIAVHGSVDSHTTVHGWRVLYAEHQWSTRDRARSGFTDLVVTDRNLATFAVLECKRVRDAEWLLFHSNGQHHNRRHAQAWLSQFHDGIFKGYGWAQVQIEPTCPEVHFCAVRGQSTNTGTTLLERTAAELALATECIAREHKAIRRSVDTDIKVFFPVIVTTATLRVATFDPASISLEDGTLESASFSDVPYVRFRKQLGVARAPSPLGGSSWTDLAYMNENTVFVVHAPAINDFLKALEVHDAGLGSNPRAAY